MPKPVTCKQTQQINFRPKHLIAQLRGWKVDDSYMNRVLFLIFSSLFYQIVDIIFTICLKFIQDKFTNFFIVAFIDSADKVHDFIFFNNLSIFVVDFD